MGEGGTGTASGGEGDRVSEGGEASVSYPKIELHVHLEGTVRAGTLLQIARRNGTPLPADSVEGLAELYEFRDFAHFIETWILTTGALRTEQDFRQVVVDYAAEAAAHGAVYLEGIFSPAEPVRRGVRWDEVFTGYCDGAQQAREQHGVEVRLTPDIPRGFPQEAAELTARNCVKYRDRGVVGLGLGGLEAEYPPEPYAPAFALARDGDIGSVPHAGEAAGVSSIRGALTALGADRIRHGIRAVDDPGLVRELADRRIVLDVCPISNLRTGVVASLAEHPLPDLVAAGVRCSVSTDDPAMFGTDLGTEYRAAVRLGILPQAIYQAGLQGALCGEETRAALRRAGEACDWASVAAAEQAISEPEGRGAAWTEERVTKERATREGGASKAPRRRAGKHSEPEGRGAASEGGRGGGWGARSASDERGGKAASVKGEREAGVAPEASGKTQ